MRLPRRAFACLLALALCWLAAPERAAAGWVDDLRDGAAAVASQQGLRAKTETAIVLGGALLYRHRHAIAGATIGCVVGSVAGATTAASAALVTGGASLSGTAPAAALGCGLGALTGVSMGRDLDNVYDERATAD